MSSTGGPARIETDPDAGATPSKADELEEYTRSGFRITHVRTPAEFDRHAASLRTLLQLNVNPDPAASSLGFHAPLSDADADVYWASVRDKLDPRAQVIQGAGKDAPPKTLYLFVLTERPPLASEASGVDEDAEVLATVQLLTVPKVTHQHRVEVAKLLVRPSAQRRGLGRIMMRFVEEYAAGRVGPAAMQGVDEGGMGRKEIMTLDTATETSAVLFYLRLGYKSWGTCPEYAEYADGRRADAMFFIKDLRESKS